MKILQVIPQLSSGGAERFTVDLCNELTELGHDVTLCVIRKLSDVSFYMSDLSDKVKVISLNKGQGFSIKSLIQMTKLIFKLKPDIIHTHVRAITYTVLAELFVKGGVHTVHNTASKEATDKLSVVVRKILFKLKRVLPVTISLDSQLSFTDFYGFDAPLVYNGRNVSSDLAVSDSVKKEIESYKKNNSTVVFIHLARFQSQKRHLVMCHAANKLYKEGYNFSLLFIGAHSDRAIYEAVRNDMSENCYILGERKNPLEYLKYAGTLVLSSSYEGLPISLIEALGVGAIPICTPVGGIPNLIQSGYNGILSSDISEESYYLALKSYLEMTDSEKSLMSQNAVNSYHPYSMKKCAVNYVKLYESIKK